MNKILVLLLLCGLVPFLLFPASTDAAIEPELYQQLGFRFIGPQGNRVIAVCGIPGNPLVYYVGAASGGIFKTTDGGAHWQPVFDGQPVSSIGSIAVAPSDTNIVWAGTGEISIRSNVSHGMGIYKSSDAGKTWKYMGLEKTGRIGRVLIHPDNPDIVYAAAMGHCYGPQQERGVFRTTDGGKTWNRVLFVDEKTGCSDILMAPDNPRILVAGMWPMRIWPWLERKSGGPGGGLHLSTDGGETWTHLKKHGLPKPPLGKIALAASPDNPDRFYALIESKEGVLWRSDDKGNSWKPINRSHSLTQRPAYYTRCAVSPGNADEVYFLATQYVVSVDGGESHRIVSPQNQPGGDHHDMWIDPLNPDRMIVGSDWCVSISRNRGKSWDKIILPIAQMYHVAVDNRIPYYVYGNRQDGPSTRGPSNSLTGAEIPSALWRPVGGCECGFAVPDPVDTHIVWTGCFEGMLDRFDLNTLQSRAVGVWPDSCLGWAAEDLKFRFQWTFPIVISPHDHRTVYVGSQYVHRTSDGGHSWSIISPDLTSNDKSKQRPFGGLTRDDESTYSCCIFAIAESPLQKDLIWAGTNDGRVQLTRDGGKSWTNLTKRLPELPEMGVVSNIEPSRYDAGTCYIAVDAHYSNIRQPYLYKTADYGKSWKRIDADIPRDALSYTHCIREDPKRPGMLYAGTENALFFSLDDGQTWLPLQHKLPHAPVHWMVVQEHFNDLVIGTYGRGFYILDDITPLRRLEPEVLNSPAHLFKPRIAYRFLRKDAPMTDPGDHSAGKNPPYGAVINYYLKDQPKNEISLTIKDEKGGIVRTITSIAKPEITSTPREAAEQEKPQATLPKKKGINRVWWDLRYNRPPIVKLRTPPPGAEFVRTQSNGWRPMPGYAQPIPVLAAPGNYSLELNADGKIYKQTLVLKQDPNSPASPGDIREQRDLLLKIDKLITRLTHMIHQAEWTRKQLRDMSEVIKDRKELKKVNEEISRLDKKILQVEQYLFQVYMTDSVNDILRLPCRLYYKLFALSAGVGQSDYPPTTQQVQVYNMFKKQIDGYREQLDDIFKKDLARFRLLLESHGLGAIIVPPAK